MVLNERVYTNSEQIADAVRNQAHCGAMYVYTGALSSLHDAVNGMAETYDTGDSLSYVWNEIRYPIVSAAVIRSGVLRLQAAARVAYQTSAATSLLHGTAQRYPKTAISCLRENIVSSRLLKVWSIDFLAMLQP